MLGCMGSRAPRCAEPGERSRAARASPADAVTSQLSPRSPEIHHAQLAGATGPGAACAGGGYKPPGRTQTNAASHRTPAPPERPPQPRDAPRAASATDKAQGPPRRGKWVWPPRGEPRRVSPWQSAPASPQRARGGQRGPQPRQESPSSPPREVSLCRGELGNTFR